MSDNFVLNIRVLTCSQCPHVEERLYGYDCNLNNLNLPFRDMKDAENVISRDCPYRKVGGSNMLRLYYDAIL